MANDSVKINLDVPVAAGPVLRKLESGIKADNPAGGEVKRERYTALRRRE